MSTARCAVAHSTDHSPCDGPADAVRLRDRRGRERLGCIHHAARALASIAPLTAFPGPTGYVGYGELGRPLSAAHAATLRARRLRPYDWRQQTPAAS